MVITMASISILHVQFIMHIGQCWPLPSKQHPRLDIHLYAASRIFRIAELYSMIAVVEARIALF